MKKLLFLGAAVLLLIAPAANKVSAEAPVGAMEQGLEAEVAEGFLCGVGCALTTDSHATLSAAGNETLHCHGVCAATGETTKFRGLSCGLFFGGSTTNSFLRITADGTANLWCKG